MTVPKNGRTLPGRIGLQRSEVVPGEAPRVDQMIQRRLSGAPAGRLNGRCCAHKRPAGLRVSNGGFQQKPTLTSTTLNVLSWSEAADPL